MMDTEAAAIATFDFLNRSGHLKNCLVSPFITTTTNFVLELSSVASSQLSVFLCRSRGQDEVSEGRLVSSKSPSRDRVQTQFKSLLERTEVSYPNEGSHSKLFLITDIFLAKKASRIEFCDRPDLSEV